MSYTLIPVNGTSNNSYYFGEKKTLERFIYSLSKQIDFSSSSTLETIESESFKDVRNLEQIVLPKTIKTIEECAFENCSDLRVIICENDASDFIIKSDAFKDCISLESVYLKAKMITIEKDAFLNCNNLRAVVFDSDNVILRKNVFSSSDLTIYAKKCKNPKLQKYCSENNITYKEFQ